MCGPIEMCGPQIISSNQPGAFLVHLIRVGGRDITALEHMIRQLPGVIGLTDPKPPKLCWLSEYF